MSSDKAKAPCFPIRTFVSDTAVFQGISKVLRRFELHLAVCLTGSETKVGNVVRNSCANLSRIIPITFILLAPLFLFSRKQHFSFSKGKRQSH